MPKCREVEACYGVEEWTTLVVVILSSGEARILHATAHHSCVPL